MRAEDVPVPFEQHYGEMWASVYSKMSGYTANNNDVNKSFYSRREPSNQIFPERAAPSVETTSTSDVVLIVAGVSFPQMGLNGLPRRMIFLQCSEW